jgi:hypothetical protein
MINEDNFIFPIRKKKDISFTDEEILFNEIFGSFRSKIENVFVKRFYNTKSTLKIGDIKTYNVQLKLA